MIVLEFIGKPSPRRDMKAYHAALKQKYPHLSESGIHAITKAELERTPPRNNRLVQHLLGEDILTDDPSRTIEAWPLMTVTERNRILRTPVAERIHLVDPVGLSKTYVWRASNGWRQEVEEQDVEVIRRSSARHWFARPETAEELTAAQRAYDFPVKESYTATNWDDAKAFERDRKRPKQWNGIILP